MDSGRRNALEFLLIILFILAFIFITLFFFLRFGDDITPPEAPSGPNDTTVGSKEVKVDLIGSDENSSIVGKTIPFVVPEGKTEIICEPGVSYHTEPFFVKNTGDIKIEYIVSISKGTSQEALDFLDAFDFWITTDPNANIHSTPLSEFRGVLEPGASTPSYYLVIAMKPTIDNKYQGKTFETVGITITAMQHGRSGKE